MYVPNPEVEMKDITSNGKSEFVPERWNKNTLTLVFSQMFFLNTVVNVLCRFTFLKKSISSMKDWQMYSNKMNNL